MGHRLHWYFRKITEAPVLRLDWEGWVKAEGRERVGRLSQVQNSKVSL